MADEGIVPKRSCAAGLAFFAGVLMAIVVAAVAISTWLSTKPPAPDVEPHTILKGKKNPEWDRFVNTRSALTPELRGHFVPFSFEFPPRWHELNTATIATTSYGGVYYESGGVVFSERLEIGWYRPNGNEPLAKVARRQVDRFGFPEPWVVIGEGVRRVGAYEGYEIVLESNIDRVVPYRFARLIVLPTGHPDGLSLLVQAREPRSVERVADVGVKGEMPGVLASFVIDPPAAPPTR
jgi:hypothetical protein